MVRTIDPPAERFSELPRAPTSNELRVLELFQQRLDRSWEIYFHPYLNGLEPDFVLFKPEVGIGVFQVMEWDEGLGSRSFRPGGPGQPPLLMVPGPEGREVSVDHENPVARVRRAKDEIYNIYCPGLPDQGGFGVITAGVILPGVSRRRAYPLFSGLKRQEEREFNRLYPVAGAEDLASGSLERIFPASGAPADSRMSGIDADVFRQWLRGPAGSDEDGLEPLALNDRQRELVTTRTLGGFRRVRGPAGSGKSVSVAARAAELADVGARVLVVCFNVTLMNYLMGLAVRRRTGREPVRRRIEFLNFHHWCRRVCESAGMGAEYRELWRLYSRDGVLDQQLPELVREVYRSERPGAGLYDAVLVDEGQDFSPLWWETLRCSLVSGGEMFLAADRTQDIYGRAHGWTDDAMSGAGFSGPWFNLETVYRLPLGIKPVLERYVESFMGDEEVDLPSEISFSGPVELRWVQVEGREGVVDVCCREASRQVRGLSPEEGYPDMVFITQSGELGRGFARELERQGVGVLHTFGDGDEESRRQKLAFRQGTPKLKATTLHSFKGWEARRLVVCVDSIGRPQDRSLLYTALTRLRHDDEGSSLTVVSTCPELRDFGRSWPDYDEVDGEGRYRRRRSGLGGLMGRRGSG